MILQCGMAGNLDLTMEYRLSWTLCTVCAFLTGGTHSSHLHTSEDSQVVAWYELKSLGSLIFIIVLDYIVYSLQKLQNLKSQPLYTWFDRQRGITFSSNGIVLNIYVRHIFWSETQLQLKFLLVLTQLVLCFSFQLVQCFASVKYVTRNTSLNICLFIIWGRVRCFWCSF